MSLPRISRRCCAKSFGTDIASVAATQLIFCLYDPVNERQDENEPAPATNKNDQRILAAKAAQHDRHP